LVYNYFQNKSDIIDVKELKYSLELIGLKFKEHEIINYLNDEDKYKLVGLNKWNLISETKFNDIDYNFNIDKLLLQILSSSRKSKIIKDRYIEGKTLEEVGCDISVTRERVRQLQVEAENKIKHPTNRKYYEPYFKYLEDLFKSSVVLDYKYFENNIKKFFGDCNIEDVIKFYNELENKEIDIIESQFVIRYPIKKLKEQIKYILKNRGVKYDEFKIIISRFIKVDNIGKLVNLLFDNIYYSEEFNYIFYANSKTDIVHIITKIFFPEGIKIYKNINNLKKYLNSFTNNLFIEDNNRAIIAKIVNKNVKFVLIKKGTYNHIENISTGKYNLNNIYRFINEQLNKSDEVTIYKVYEKYKKYLHQIKIDNYYFLYTLLKLKFNKKYNFYKFPRIIRKNEKEKHIYDFNELIEKFLYDKEGPVNKKVLKEKFIQEIGLHDYTLDMCLNDNENIIKLDKNKYIHSDYYNPNIEVINEIYNWILNYFNSNKVEYITIGKVYQKNRVLCEKANVDEKRQLYHILKNNFSEEIKFSYPKITVFTKLKNRTITKSVEEYLLNKNESAFRNEIYDYFKKIGFNEKQIYSALYSSNKIIPIINGTEYIHINNSQLNETIIHKMEDRILNILNKSDKIYLTINDNLLEKLSGNLWTIDLVIYFIKDYDKAKLIGTLKKIIINKNNKLNISNNIDFISYILKNKFNKFAYIKEFEKHLNQIEFCSSKFPEKYKINSAPYVVNNNEIYHKSL